MKPVRFIIFSLLLCFGLVGCIQRELSALEVIIGPTLVPPTDMPEIQISPSSTPPPTPTPDPTSTPTHTPTIQSTATLCIAENGQIEIKQLTSEWISKQLNYRVYTPPCYNQLPDQRYPVLYLLHGYGSNDDQWERLGVGEVADQLIASGEITPLLIVMPHDQDHNVQPPKNLFGESILFDLVPAVDTEYRTIPSSKYRAIGGLSRGGNWAVHIGLPNWTLFGLIGAHSAPLFVSDDSSQIKYWLDQIPPNAYPRIYIDVGEKDKWLQRIISFEETLDMYNLPHELFIFPGGHTEEYWSSHVEQYLRWYTREW